MLRTREKIDCLQPLKMGEKLKAKIKCSFQKVIWIAEADTRTAEFDNVYIYIASVYKEVGVLLANMTRFTKGTDHFC